MPPGEKYDFYGLKKSKKIMTIHEENSRVTTVGKQANSKFLIR